MEEGNSGIAPFVGFFVVLLIIAFVTSGGEDGERRALFSTGSSTTTEETSTRGSTNRSVTEREEVISAPEEEVESLSNREIERAIDRLYDDLDDLEEDLREAEIWGERSRFENKITMSKGNVFTEDAEREYLILRASSRNDEPIDISGWLFESYVTEEGATIPFGSRAYRKGQLNTTEAIFLEPGEKAFVITDESPIGVSFHENKCTGYLTEFQDFRPSLTRSCPRPIDELEDFGRIDFDNDACYEFVEDINRCRIPKQRDIDEADLSNGCQRFIRDHLDYNRCLENHRFDPFFDKGEWYIYLGRTDELWRKEREIIRLTDLSDRTVDVIEY